MFDAYCITSRRVVVFQKSGSFSLLNHVRKHTHTQDSEMFEHAVIDSGF